MIDFLVLRIVAALKSLCIRCNISLTYLYDQFYADVSSVVLLLLQLLYYLRNCHLKDHRLNYKKDNLIPLPFKHISKYFQCLWIPSLKKNLSLLITNRTKFQSMSPAESIVSVSYLKVLASKFLWGCNMLIPCLFWEIKIVPSSHGRDGDLDKCMAIIWTLSLSSVCIELMGNLHISSDAGNLNSLLNYGLWGFPLGPNAIIHILKNKLCSITVLD